MTNPPIFAKPALVPDIETVLVISKLFGPGDMTSRVATAIKVKIVFISIVSFAYSNAGMSNYNKL